MFDCSLATAARSFFAQLFKKHFPRFDGRTQAMNYSPRQESPAEEKMGSASVRKPPVYRYPPSYIPPKQRGRTKAARAVTMSTLPQLCLPTTSFSAR
jgi:hypothetical protein